jgi:hypothetical protein
MSPARRARKVSKLNQKQMERRQEAATKQNQDNERENNKSNAYNRYSEGAINRFKSTTGGDYVSIRDGINTKELRQAGFSDEEINDLQNQNKQQFRQFYLNEKVSQWDSAAFGAQPRNGTFDADYYIKKSDPSIKQKWREAEANDDLDITQRYGSIQNFAHWSYGSTGRAQGLAANRENARAGGDIAAQDLTAVEDYSEVMTDAQMSSVRTDMLGFEPGDKGEEDMVDAESFLGSVLESDTLREDIAGQAKFYALQKDVINKVNAAREKMTREEQENNLYMQFPQFADYKNANKNIANELLSGLGGMGGMMGLGGIKGSIEGLADRLTGMGENKNKYDWQKFFDEELADKYGDMETISSDEYGELKLDQDFRDKFINDYLKPRFDGSKSMAEFLSYMDIKQNEENVYQTQTTLNAIRTVVARETKAFVDQLKERNESPREFDTEFYFNPQGDKSIYEEQKTQVSEDWEIAKNSPETLVDGTDKTWRQWAYYHGMDVNKAEDFAKLHYQVKGRIEGFDGAKDLLTQNDVRTFIQDSIIPAIAEVKTKAGENAFLPFETPDDFIDTALSGLNPLDSDEWKNTLKELGYKDEDIDKLSDLDDVKETIKETLGSLEGADIRERIKELNKRRQDIDQTTLGGDYIVRESDKEKIEDDSNDFLYQQYVAGGYEGTRDEFYKDFFPDDPGAAGEMAELGKFMSEGFGDLDFSDPFSALGTVGGLMKDDDYSGNLFIMGDEMPGDNTEQYESMFSTSPAGGDDPFGGYRSSSGSSLIDQFSSFG